MKFLLILLAIILVIPSSAFAGTWTIRIDQIRPIINYMKRLHPQKQQNSVSHIIKVAVTPPKPAGNKTPARSLKLGKPGAVIKVVKKSSKVAAEKPKVKPARIHGSTAGLPVLSVNFVKTPLWKALQTLSNKTGYMFSAQGISLAKKITIKGTYNLAGLLARLFANDNTIVNLRTKKVKIKEEK